ncbi:MAG: PKD domain-containing protein, partial [Candidatus Uhrbacteria bacterium]
MQRWMTRFVCALAVSGALFGVGAVVHAQEELPDLHIRDAAFVAPHRIEFVYENASTVAAPSNFTIVFQWVDATGTSVGAPRMLPVQAPMPQKGIVLNTGGLSVSYERRWLFFRRAGRQALDDYLTEQPDGATAIRLIVDADRVIEELNEQNNEVVLEVPVAQHVSRSWDAAITDFFARQFSRELPNLRLTGVGTGAAEDRLWVSFVNNGKVALQDGTKTPIPTLALTWADVHAQPISGAPRFTISCQISASERVPRHEVAYLHSVVNDPQALMFLAEDGRLASLREVFASMPSEADRLLATMDADNVFAESNEMDNTMSIRVRKPNLQMLDIALQSQNPALHISFTNNGDAPVRSVTGTSRIPMSVLLTWADANDIPVMGAEQYLVDVSASTEDLLPSTAAITLVLANNADSPVFQNIGAAPRRIGLDAMLRAMPKGAQRLLVTIDGTQNIVELEEADNTLSVFVARPTGDVSTAASATSEATSAASQLMRRPNLLFRAAGFTNDGALQFRFANIGDGDVTAPFRISLKWLDETGAPVAPEQSITRYPLISEADEFVVSRSFEELTEYLALRPINAIQIRIVLDSDHGVEERNEDDNVMFVRIPADWIVKEEVDKITGPAQHETAVLLPADLTVQATLEAQRTLRVRVGNSGESSVSETAVSGQWFAGDRPLGKAAVIARALPINPGSERALTFTIGDDDAMALLLADPPDDATQFIVRVDPRNVIREQSEANNTRAVLRTAFPMPPNFVIRRADFADTQVTIVYENLGGTALMAADAFTIQFEWLGENRKRIGNVYRYVTTAPDGGEVRALRSEQATVITSVNGVDGLAVSLDAVIASLPEDARSLQVSLDSSASFSESNESDNMVILALPIAQPPIAIAGDDVTLIDRNGDGIEYLELDGARSHASGGALTHWSWVVDGKIIGSLPSLYYPTALGKTTVTLTVTDKNGRQASDTLVATVVAAPDVADQSNLAPYAHAGGLIEIRDTNGDGGETVKFNGSDSKDPDGSIARWEWMDGGRTIGTTSRPSSWLAVGVHTISLHIWDDDGRMSADTVRVEVLPFRGENVLPIAVAGEDLELIDTNGDRGETAMLDGSG